MLEKREYKQGIQIFKDDKDFREGLAAAVDYRGDVSLELNDGQVIEGFLFNSAQDSLDLFPKNSPQKQRVLIKDLKRIEFSGQDEAAGKSWDDWVKKRQQKKQSVEN